MYMKIEPYNSLRCICDKNESTLQHTF